MSDAVELIGQVLGNACLDASMARAILETALEREVDPLHYCATVLGVSDAALMERAAAWIGLAFYPKVPSHLEGQLQPLRLEALRDVRLVRLKVLDRDVAFCAPDFLGLLRLKAALRQHPELARYLCLVPERSLRSYLVRGAGRALIDSARQNLSRRWPRAAAQLELTAGARSAFVLGVVMLVALVLMAPYVSQLYLLPFAILMLVVPALVRIAALAVTPHEAPQSSERGNDADLPVYSVLIPLRDEAAMVPQLAEAMAALNYPPDKLDIIFVVEASSTTTVEAVQAQLHHPQFSLVAVPDAAPRTKPKALDFALPLCRGEFVVIFDAEDTPHPDQLWRVAHRFRDAPQLQCVQARLVIDNGTENWLTALFAGEYAGLFTVVLPALSRWGLPMPLGGTSNHFRVDTLRSMGGWDAFNVTEDADLGMRLARLHHAVETIDIGTVEEAPTQLGTWMAQRSRWMKGWMQTFIVHNRDPRLLLRHAGLGRTLAFELMILSMIIAPLLHVGLLATLLARWLLGVSPWASGWDFWSLLYLGIFALGYGSAVATTWAGLRRLERDDLLLVQLLLPFYWLLSAAATLRALHELTNRPFHWSKTRHRPVSRNRLRLPAPARTGWQLFAGR
ncbi:glycosyltransferase [Devosia sp. 919]|uniref:glycosyltransferase n=2 Tax=unclassified Devosia TaxID=196773 RepID=UPI00155294BF|nr:glycosyltransferase [Devosia sp. 919]